MQKTRHRTGGKKVSPRSLNHVSNTIVRHGRRSYVGTASDTRRLFAFPKSTGRSQRRFSCVTPFRRHASIPFPYVRSLIRQCQGYIPLPKSSSERRIRSNLEVYDFELTPEEVAHLDSLDESASAHAVSTVFGLIARYQGLSRTGILPIRPESSDVFVRPAVRPYDRAKLRVAVERCSVPAG